jgi:hypothetical protein
MSFIKDREGKKAVLKDWFPVHQNYVVIITRWGRACLYSPNHREEGSSLKFKRTAAKKNVPKYVKTPSSCSANIQVSVPTRGGASALCVERGYKKGKKVMMPNKISALAQRPLWIIACCRNNRMQVLTIDPDCDGGFLPVFSFKDEADTFVCLWEDDQEMCRRWHSRQTTTGELVSVLLAPCADVQQVALDPLPLSLGRAMLPYISVARERFVEDLMGGGRELAGEPVPA